MHHQSFGYFGLQGIGNVNKVIPNPYLLSALQNLSDSAQEVKSFYGRVLSYMIAKLIEGSIKNTSLKKLRLHRG